ncbi:MAG TPA: HNH endonuclease domain-containing protein [Spirochaetota bacterium]|nr:HNH endonuclease domain-containing protein [Spirochaetota bacterium]
MGARPPQPELNIPALERSLELSSLTNSYKLYWFAALLDEINACSAEITFDRMVALMIVRCWYSVLKFRLSFGSQDTLHRIVHYLHEKYNLPAEINPAELKDFLAGLHDEEYDKAVKEFSRYVPYRFLTPFYAEETRGINDSQKNRIIEDLSRKDDSAPYRINSAESVIILNYNWFEYLYCSMAIITGWHRYRLVEFLQRRNPNVPAVIDKLEPPLKRDLADATKFWKNIITVAETQNCPHRGLGGLINDIYTGRPITLSDMSLDHFIPWSFVLHDRMWNLVPVSKSINSSKSDLLPPLEKYLDSFIDLQFTAYTTALEIGINSKTLEDYYLLGAGNTTSSPVPPSGQTV